MRVDRFWHVGLHVTEALEKYTDINLRRVMENSLKRAGEPEPSNVVSEAVGRDGVGTRSEVCRCNQKTIPNKQ